MSVEMPEGERLRGFADLHVHQFADRAFGGRTLWGAPSGDPAEVLGSCCSVHGPHGLTDWVGNLSRVLFTGDSWTALLGHRTRGWPSFRAWPAWDDYTHQSVHEQWLRRAVDGGLRLVVVVALQNELLCRLSTWGRSGCTDMDAVDAQVAAAHAFAAHVDKAAGGPGRGWYRIVGTPAEARDVIASGRLAVVLGIEVDAVFGGRRDRSPSPDELTATLHRYHAAGVRHVIPLHFADNAYGGAAFALALHWSANNGPVSKANPLVSLPIYRMRTARRWEEGYRYRDGHCNDRGLTPLGRQMVSEMLSLGMVVDVDHMAARTRADVLDLAAAAGRPVLASHSEMQELSRPELRSERQLRRVEIEQIAATGGAVAPLLRQPTVDLPNLQRGTAESFRRAWTYVQDVTGSDWIGFGSDLNGFAGLPRPGLDRLAYPFPAPLGGRPMDRSVVGERIFDLGVDGVAHAGLLPDLLAHLAAQGADIGPLLRSAAGYVDLWDRAGSGTAVP